MSSRKKTIALFQKYVFLLQSSLENPSFTFEAFEQGILLWMTNYLFSLGVAHKIFHIPKQNNNKNKITKWGKTLPSTFCNQRNVTYFENISVQSFSTFGNVRNNMKCQRRRDFSFDVRVNFRTILRVIIIFTLEYLS